ncbi:MAG: PHB depolymerase family esterase [Rubrivivax sp.]|nr:PHB depolymerase family esterase [Rubrivivax sp.]
MNPSLQDLMRDATRLTRAGRLGAATAAIQSALAGAAPGPAGSMPPVGPAAVPPVAPSVPGDRPRMPDRSAGTFTPGSHTHAALTRGYKLYVPPGAQGRSRPLVVMLHGCTQDADDFAAGTGMNALADEHGCLVLYPAQAADANPSRCWNWFKHNHQGRDRGEAACIAAMAQAVVRAQGADADRVYIAGLSAGGAMASAVAAAHPDVFAAVGVHSGLAPGAARSLPEAMAAMRGGDTGPALAGLRAHAQPLSRPAGAAALPVPTIVFHGDQDPTVHPRNGEQVIAAALRGRPHQAAGFVGATVVERGVSAQGLRYTCTRHGAASGPAVAEHWVVHGAGHAWSGGRPAGSYTDPRGPDASREMLRFFLGHTRRAGH